MTQELAAFLRTKRAIVDGALDRLLPSSTTPPVRLHEAMRASVLAGGKRLRPVLAIAAFEVAGGRGEAIVAPACATELIHTYSLVHDDLPAMDDDDLRRGRPTCHRVFGEALAILAGDALLTLAFEIVAADASLAPERRAAIVRALASANGSLGMVGGQAADIESEGSEPSVDAVHAIHLRKTALPLSAALAVGALAAGAPEEVLDALSAYGERIGLAFQIVDDLLDVRGTAHEVGKAVGKDLARGKLTYPGAVGSERAAERAHALSDEAQETIRPLGDRAWALRELARFVVERRT